MNKRTWFKKLIQQNENVIFLIDTLDIKQYVSFEVMPLSFILKSLHIHNVSQDLIEKYFTVNETQKCERIKSLSQLKTYEKERWYQRLRNVLY